MVKNNLTNFVKCGVRHNFLCSVILPLWVLLLLAGLCEGVWCGVSGRVCRECEKDDGFKLRRKSSAGRALVCFL